MELIKFISSFLSFKKYLSKTKDKIILLTYHGLVNEITNERLQRNFHTIEQFENHMKFLLKNHFIFLNATELAFYTQNPNEIKHRKMVAITFDDGYQNNLQAIKILNKYTISGTFFVSSDTINSPISIWTVNLSLLLLEGDSQSINFNDKVFALHNYEARLIAFNEIRNHLKTCNSKDRINFLDELTSQFPENELQKLINKHHYFKMLTWNEIKQVQSENIQFHSHGNYHEIHHQWQEESTIENEIEKSKATIESNLNTNVFLFAYPNGNYNPISDKYLLKNNYKAAFVLGEQTFNNEAKIYSIPRITPNGKLKKFKIQIEK